MDGHQRAIEETIGNPSADSITVNSFSKMIGFQSLVVPSRNCKLVAFKPGVMPASGGPLYCCLVVVRWHNLGKED